MRRTEIIAELNRLISQQTETIKGKLGPTEAEEYASRSARIRELFALLNEPWDSQSD